MDLLKTLKAVNRSSSGNKINVASPTNTATVNDILQGKGVLLKDTLTIVDNLNFDEREDSSGVAARSIISKTIFSYDVPEIENFSADFVYNYFEKNERSFDNSNRRNDRIVNLEADINCAIIIPSGLSKISINISCIYILFFNVLLKTISKEVLNNKERATYKIDKTINISKVLNVLLSIYKPA